MAETNADKLERLQRETEAAQKILDDAQYQRELAEDKAKRLRSN